MTPFLIMRKLTLFGFACILQALCLTSCEKEKVYIYTTDGGYSTSVEMVDKSLNGKVKSVAVYGHWCTVGTDGFEPEDNIRYVTYDEYDRNGVHKRNETYIQAGDGTEAGLRITQKFILQDYDKDKMRWLTQLRIYYIYRNSRLTLDHAYAYKYSNVYDDDAGTVTNYTYYNSDYNSNSQFKPYGKTVYRMLPNGHASSDIIASYEPQQSRSNTFTNDEDFADKSSQRHVVVEKDDKGNWIERYDEWIEYDEDGSVKSRSANNYEKRTITYYP